MTAREMSPASKRKFGNAIHVIQLAEKRGLKYGREYWIAALLGHAVLTMCRGAATKKAARAQRDYTKRAISEMFRIIITHWKESYPEKRK